MIGTSIGKYRVVGPLGKGSMGVVYHAIDDTIERDVAIKVLNPELADPRIIKRFRSEATALARLNHAGIATLYELVETDADLLIVMEYVRGETLEKLAQRMGPLPPEQAAFLVTEILAALRHAHRAGVVHCDIKPANVMLTDDRTVKILDFGTARVRGIERSTVDGYMMGTPAYMAPEQVVGGEVDGRADLYAVGVILYRLVTGALPFEGDNMMAVLQKKMTELPTPLNKHRQGLPGWCGATIRRALARLPADRFQNADEFRDALQPAAGTVTREMAETALAPATPVDTVAQPIRTIVLDEHGAAAAASQMSPHVATQVSPHVTTQAAPHAATQAAPAPVRRWPVAFPQVVMLRALVAVLGVVVLWQVFRPPPPPPQVAAVAEPPPVTTTSTTSTVPPPAPSAAEPPVPEAAKTPGPPPAANSGTKARPPAPRTTTTTTTRPAPATAAPAEPPPPPATEHKPTASAIPPVPSAIVAPSRGTALSVPYVFDATTVMGEGDKQRDRPSRVVLAEGRVTVQASDDHSQLYVVPYTGVVSISYSRGRDPLWNGPSGPTRVLRAGRDALGVFRGTRHWVSLRLGGGGDQFVALRLGNEDQARRAIVALQERIGRLAELVAEPK